MRRIELVILVILWVAISAFTPSGFMRVFILWTGALLLIGWIVIRKVYKALSEITCAVFNNDDWYKNTMTSEAEAYDILKERIDEGDIYDGMTIKEIDAFLKEKYKEGYYDRLSMIFGEYPTNKDRLNKGKHKIEVRNLKTFPRKVLVFGVKDGKVKWIQDTIDSGRDIF